MFGCGHRKSWLKVEVLSGVKFLQLQGTNQQKFNVILFLGIVLKLYRIYKGELWAPSSIEGTEYALNHSPYIHDLSPCDSHLFGPLEKNLGGTSFTIDAEVHEGVIKWLTDFLQMSMVWSTDGRMSGHADMLRNYMNRCYTTVYQYVWICDKVCSWKLFLPYFLKHLYIYFVVYEKSAWKG